MGGKGPITSTEAPSQPLGGDWTLGCTAASRSSQTPGHPWTGTHHYCPSGWQEVAVEETAGMRGPSMWREAAGPQVRVSTRRGAEPTGRDCGSRTLPPPGLPPWEVESSEERWVLSSAKESTPAGT